jgi:hypothetical protein
VDVSDELSLGWDIRQVKFKLLHINCSDVLVSFSVSGNLPILGNERSRLGLAAFGRQARDCYTLGTSGVPPQPGRCFVPKSFLVQGEDRAKRRINPIILKDGVPSFHVIESARAVDRTRTRNLSRPPTSDQR